MALTVTRSDVWAASIVDRAGGLAEKLAALAEAGAVGVCHFATGTRHAGHRRRFPDSAQRRSPAEGCQEGWLRKDAESALAAN